MSRLPLLALLVVAACAPQPTQVAPQCLELPEEQGPAVARVGQASITARQIADRVRGQGSSAVRRYSSDKALLRQFIEDQIRFELLVRAGLERGLAQDPDVIYEARKVMVRKLLQHDLGATALADAVSDAAIQRYYEEHQLDYMQPEKRRLMQIQLLPNDEGRALAMNIIASLREQPDDREQFRVLAVRHSLDEESRARAGELLFKSAEELTEQYGPSFAAEVFRLEPGELAGEPVQSIRGWHVVQLLSRREPLLRSFDEVRDDIREKLLKGQRAKQFDAYLAEIRERYPVALQDDRIDDVLAELARTSTPRSP